MSRLPMDEARAARIAEEGLFLVGEVKEHISKEVRLIRYLGGLDEADRLELAQAQADVEEATVRLRAARGQLAAVEQRCTQKREIRNQILVDFDLETREVEDIGRVIAIDAHAIGVKHIRPELFTECSPSERGTV